MLSSGLKIQLMAFGKNSCVFTVMPLHGRHKFNAAVLVLTVVPSDELQDPLTCVIQAGEPVKGKVRSVLDGAKQRFRIRVVIAHSWTGVCGLYT